MKNILVTGANGQLGRSMRDVAKQTANNYIFTDIEELDITDAKAVNAFIGGNQIDIVVNCAAYTNVDKAEEDEATAMLLNCTAVENLASAAKGHGATLIHISTDYVFGGEGNTPRSEELPTSPLGVYGSTKLAGEEVALKAGCNSIIIRTAWLYSPYGNNFVKTMRRLTSERDTLSVVFDQVGTPTYAADLARIIYKIIEDNQLSKTGIYHFSNEGVCSWYDFAVEIAALSNSKCSIAPCHSSEFPSKVKRPSYSVLDKTKIKHTFGIEIPHWKTSLTECINILNNTAL